MKTFALVIGLVLLLGIGAAAGYGYESWHLTGGVDVPLVGRLGAASPFGAFGQAGFNPSGLSQQQLQQFRQNFGNRQNGQGGQPGQSGQNGQGTASGRGAFIPGGAGTVGTIESIDNGTITIQTQSGTVKAVTTDTTLIEKQMAVKASDLAKGDQVIVSGSTGTDGTVTARSIRVISGAAGSQ